MPPPLAANYVAATPSAIRAWGSARCPSCVRTVTSRGFRLAPNGGYQQVAFVKEKPIAEAMSVSEKSLFERLAALEKLSVLPPDAPFEQVLQSMVDGLVPSLADLAVLVLAPGSSGRDVTVASRQ